MDNPFSSFELWAGLFGGLALFLFGMDIMTQALKSAAGDYMKDLLSKLTRNRLVGVGMGAFVTAVIQSSSVTTVILVGFISPGLMSMSQSVAVIMGAHIGTTKCSPRTSRAPLGARAASNGFRRLPAERHRRPR